MFNLLYAALPEQMRYIEGLRKSMAAIRKVLAVHKVVAFPIPCSANKCVNSDAKTAERARMLHLVARSVVGQRLSHGAGYA